MLKCMHCGKEVKRIESIGLEMGNFILNDNQHKDKKVKFSISIGSKRKVILIPRMALWKKPIIVRNVKKHLRYLI